MTNENPLIDAATVMIVRDRPEGMEVFMVVRHHQIDFASGALVFPGGKVDAGDRDPALVEYCVGADGLDAREVAFRIGAIRESFEECGVLFAREKGALDYLSASRLQELDVWRDRFNAGTCDMLTFAREEGLEFVLDAFGHFAHWITPDLMPKRFDTHFFLARAPEDHVALHDGSESVDSVWIRPADAIIAADAGERTIIFPTRMNVEKLMRSSDVAVALASCGNVVTVEPFLKKEEDGTTFLRMQVDAGYGDPKEPLGRLPK